MNRKRFWILLACVTVVLLCMQNTQAVVTNGLVGFWKFEDNAADSSVHNHFGTLYGHSRYRSGQLGRGLDLDGNGDYVIIDNSDGALNITGSITVEAWVRMDNYHSGSRYIYRKKDSHALLLYNGRVSMRIGVCLYSPSNTGVTTGEWTHVAMSYNGVTKKIFINGEVKSSLVEASGSTAGSTVSISDITDSFDGRLDEIKVYNRDLTGDEIVLNYLEGIRVKGYWPFELSQEAAFQIDQGYTNGVSWADMDGDGDADLFVTNRTQENNILYQNNGDGTFTKVTSGNIVNDGGGSYGACWGDYDNNGYPDLYVANTGNSKNFLYSNHGGTFVKVTSGDIVNDKYDSRSACWGDYNNDGHLDIFVANYQQNNCLYQNNGDGTFTRITDGNIVNSVSYSIGASWCDYDNDGYIDLYVSNYDYTANELYHNNGDDTFTKVTGDPVVQDSDKSCGCSWGDYNNDGYFDIYVANATGMNHLYRNNGDGSFEKVYYNNITDFSQDSRGSGWGDVNNDGYLDLMVANQLVPSHVFINARGTDFNDYYIDTFMAVGGAWCDYDDDGWLDLFMANNNDVNKFYTYDGSGSHYLSVSCVGTESNKSGIGAKVSLKIGSDWQTRQISSQTGYCGQNEMVAAFGLGDAVSADMIRIEWPSGIVWDTTDVAADQFLTVTERLPNTAPVAVDDEASTNQETPVTIEVLDNDTDADGDALSVQSVDDSGATGTVEIDPGNITVTYTPDNQLFGMDSFQYTITDGRGGLSTATVTVEVIEVNYPPVAVDDNVNILRNTVATISVLDNDSDPNGDELKVSEIISNGLQGVAIIPSGQTSVIYTPPVDFVGMDHFQYVASDSRGGLDTATVTIEIQLENLPPVALDDDLTIGQDSTVTIYPLENDSDPNGDALTIAEIIGVGSQGTVLLNSGDTSMTYVPPLGFTGNTAFDYVVSDGRGGLDTATVSIEVLPVSAIEGSALPERFSLSQNFPNPFNPATKISYTLPEKSFVALRIFTITGREILCLVNEEKAAGEYEVMWNAHDQFGQPVGSGIYFYQLKAGDFMEIRKMLLVR